MRLSLSTPLPVDASFAFDLCTEIVGGPDVWTVEDFNGIPAVPGFTPEPILFSTLGASLRNDKGLSLVVMRNLFSAKWSGAPNHISHPEFGYKGYESLVEGLTTILSAVEKLIGKDSLRFRVANMSYQVLLPSGRVTEYVQTTESRLLEFGTLRSSDLAMQCGDGIECRMSTLRGEPDAAESVVETAAGLIHEPVSFAESIEKLNAVHSRLVEMFDIVITPLANKEWKRR